MNLERFLFEQGFKPDTYRTRVLATFIALILNPTDTDITLKQEVSMLLNTSLNNISQHLYWIKNRYNKMNNDEFKNRTPLEIVYLLAYKFRDLGGK